MDDRAAATAVIERAATDLARARRHAVWLERIAAMVLAFAACTGAAVAVADGNLLLWEGVGLALAGAAGWGVVRLLALVLHLQVDDRMVALADPDPEAEPEPDRAGA